MHVNLDDKKNNVEYLKEWLEVAGVDFDKQSVISGDIIAKNVLVPEQAMCAVPSIKQLEWIHAKVKIFLEKKEAEMLSELQYDLCRKWNDLSQLRECETEQSHHADGLLVVFKRSKKRKLAQFSWDELVIGLQATAKVHNLKLVILKDTQMPSVKYQLKIMSQAKVMIAVHGASHVNQFGMEPGNCVVEVSNPIYLLAMYGRIAFFQGLHFFGVSMTREGFENDPRMRAEDSVVNVTELISAVERCPGLSRK